MTIMKLQLMLLTLVLITARSKFEITSMDSSLFTSNPQLESKVFNASGWHVTGVSDIACSFLCLRLTGCFAFAVHSGPEVRNCIVYEANVEGVSLLAKDGYRIFVKVVNVDRTSNQAMTTSSNATDELHEEWMKTDSYYRYEKGVGCPAGFNYHDSVCYRVIFNFKKSYSDVMKSTPNPIASRLAKIRDQGALQFIANQLNPNVDSVFVGLRNVDERDKDTADWRWTDGTPGPNVKDGTWWTNGDPNYTAEEYVVLKPPNHCWNDAMWTATANAVCQNKVLEGTTQCPEGYSLHNKVCYLLTDEATFACDGDRLCDKINATIVNIQSSDDHKFVVNLIANSKISKNAQFSIGVKIKCASYAKNCTNFDGTALKKFGQWCPGQPDGPREACGQLARSTENGATTWKLRDVQCFWSGSFVWEWMASSCAEWHHVGQQTSGIYRIRPRGAQVEFQVYCDMSSDGGGWTVIQSRQGTASFVLPKNLAAYEIGYAIGDKFNEYFLGLERIFLLTSQEEVSLTMNITDTRNRSYTIRYGRFEITNETSYEFKVRNFSATNGLPDEFSKQQGSKFSVDDRKGGWWFTPGTTVNFNGNYPGGESATISQWSSGVLLAKTTMKVKSTYFSNYVDPPVG